MSTISYGSAAQATAANVGAAGIRSRVDLVIETALAEKRIVGTVVLVKKHGELVCRQAGGWADRETRRPMQEDAVFRLASITKPIVSAAAMRLVERGGIALTDRVEDWLPGFRPALTAGTQPAITLHHLLTHTSGLSYCFLEGSDGAYRRLGISDGFDRPELSLEENLDLIAQAPLFFAPGGSWRYSLGIDVLGAVLERATGKSLPDLVEELVTGPLSMLTTRFRPEAGTVLATPYASGAPEPIPMTDGIEVPIYDGYVRFIPSRSLSATAYPSGGAGMIGSADDIMAFMEAIRAGGGPILTKQTVDEMMRDHVGPQAETQGPGWGFGYGWAVLSQPSLSDTPQNAGTIQWGGAYGHSWFVDRSAGLSVVALTNTAFEGMNGAFPIQIRDAIYG